jgi:hypothetical protein
MTNYAQIDNRDAYLSTDFGEEIARKWFGDESVDALPRYVRGPRKGKIKGAVTWTKVLRGGWVRGAGYVENRVGHIFERKLHEIGSDRFGTSIGRVIRDLDREESQKQYIENIRRRIDEEIRKYDMERMQYENLILSGLVDNVIDILQEKIKEYNEDIAVLCEDLAKTYK